jgi:rhodanese-related sulfurtransferase
MRFAVSRTGGSQVSLLDLLRKALGRPQEEVRSAGTNPPGRQPEPEEELRVPEVTTGELQQELQSAAPPLLLDCREPIERRQSYIPGSMHIPMNSIPGRLADLDPNRRVVVYCAHGNRSYGVAGWLLQQGYDAASLRGGIVDWQIRGGRVESDYRRA